MAILKWAMLTAVITVTIFVAFSVRYIEPGVKENSTGDDRREGITLSSADAEKIFFGQDSWSISMYGDPLYWDDEKNMSVDTDGDGQNDMNFAIASSKSEGINLEGSVKQLDGSWKSMNFWTSDLYRMYVVTLKEKEQNRTNRAKDFLTLDLSALLSILQEGKYAVKGGSIMEDAYVQLSVFDIDEDGSVEVLASVGNRSDEAVTAVYEISRTDGAPFVYSGRIIIE